VGEEGEGEGEEEDASFRKEREEKPKVGPKISRDWYSQRGEREERRRGIERWKRGGGGGGRKERDDCALARWAGRGAGRGALFYV
jgi:hypothetical protein